MTRGKIRGACQMIQVSRDMIFIYVIKILRGGGNYIVIELYMSQCVKEGNLIVLSFFSFCLFIKQQGRVLLQEDLRKNP